MSVRAKFTLKSYESTLIIQQKPGSTNYNPEDVEQFEMRTLVFHPVYGDSDENKRFWRASPSGEIRLGTVNRDAWSEFDLGKSYYVDFTEADQ